MFKNYFVTALRSFAKNKLVTFINITGLAIGLACVLLVFLFVQYEFSVDKFIEKIDRLYLVTIVGENRDVSHTMEHRSDIVETLAPQLVQDYPEITNVVRLMPWQGKVDFKKRGIRENRFWFTDPHIFSMLTLPLKRGNPMTVLQAPNSVVITPAMAVKYFGDEDPVGKTIKILMSLWPVSYTLTITGIIEPLPKTSSFKIDFLAHVPFDRISMDRKKRSSDRFMNAWSLTLVELPDAVSTKLLQEKLSKHECFDREKEFNLRNLKYRLEPFRDAYLKSNATFFESDADPHQQDEAMRTSDIRLMVFLTVLGCIILVVSCINIINLATARSTLRAREIGVRKVVGAQQRQLIFQFITETILLSYMALGFALLLTELLLPSFNTLIKRELSVNYTTNWVFLLGMIGIATLTGIVSGIYPAFVLSAFKPITALKSVRLQSSTLVRKSLMILQIGLCVGVFLFALVMLDEIKALKIKDCGFNSRDLIFFQIDDKELVKRYPAFKREILRIPGVANITASSFVPWQYGIIPAVSWYNENIAARTRLIPADTSFMETYQISIVEGEGFRTNRLRMDGYTIINETARKVLQSNGTDPLSKNICSSFGWCNRVRGVMKDFNFFYPAKRIRPLAIVSSRYVLYFQNQVTIRMAAGNHIPILAKIETAVKRFFPQAPFEYQYVAKEMEKMHKQKMGYRWMALLFVTGFALFIAAVGLFGFATYETERCTKEIGIRKSLGAKPMQIVLYFILRFFRLTLIANVIAWPICYFIIHRILKIIDYPHPIQINFTHFLWAGLLTLVLTIVTVWAQTYRAALVDPVKALRYE